jgi:hypothetical protein
MNVEGEVHRTAANDVNARHRGCRESPARAVKIGVATPPCDLIIGDAYMISE